MITWEGRVEKELLSRYEIVYIFLFFFSSRRRHTRLQGDWSSDVCSSDLTSTNYIAIENNDSLVCDFFEIRIL